MCAWLHRAVLVPPMHAAACAALFAQVPERVVIVDLLDNGSGEARVQVPADDERALLVPWWIASGAPRTQPASANGLVLEPGASLWQPIAAFAPLAEGFEISGRVEGQGSVLLEDGRGQFVELQVRDQSFDVSAAQITKKFGQASSPRFTLSISAPRDSSGARFFDLHALVPLPCPDEAALAAELRALCDEVFLHWLERGVDRKGARPTAFLTTRFDAVSGAELGVAASGLHPLYESLLAASAVSDNPAWRAGLEAYLRDFLELGFHPASGMPREWDGELDLPQDSKPVEVARYLAFLIDVSERGPQDFRERARGQARRMAATIQQHGLQPDGSVAVSYNPANGLPAAAPASIRRLDVAAQLARLGKLDGDRRLIDAARDALAELEFTHFWGGTWSSLDPDFDDSWGNWGKCATLMLAAAPEDPSFQRFTSRGFEHFAPLWRDGLRFGGSIAADQTRCWEFLLRHAQIEPRLRAPLDELLRAAVRAHFKGEQYGSGAWGDLSFTQFSPRGNLNVGDFTGYPSNLAWGLACVYRVGSALRDENTRAMFTAVLRSSKQVYRRPFGWLLSKENTRGDNYAGGELRMLLGVTEMLENLSR